MEQPVNQTAATVVNKLCTKYVWNVAKGYNLSIKLQLPCKQVVYKECKLLH